MVALAKIEPKRIRLERGKLEAEFEEIKFFIEREERRKHPLYIFLLVLFVLSTGIESMDTRLIAMGALLLFGGGAWVYKSPEVVQARARLTEVTQFLMKFEEGGSDPVSEAQPAVKDSSPMPQKKKKVQSRKERKKSSRLS